MQDLLPKLRKTGAIRCLNPVLICRALKAVVLETFPRGAERGMSAHPQR